MQYVIYNATDDILASPDTFNKEEAEQFIINFRERYNVQGYYRTVKGRNILPEQIELEIWEAA